MECSLKTNASFWKSFPFKEPFYLFVLSWVMRINSSVMDEMVWRVKCHYGRRWAFILSSSQVPWLLDDIFWQWRKECVVLWPFASVFFWPWRGSSTQVTGHESTLLEDNWADVVQELGIKSIKESCRAGWIIDWLLFWLAGSPRVKCSDKQILYQYRNHIDQMKESEYLFLSPDLDGKSQELYPAV